MTGANSGIGYAAAKAFAKRGATVVLACRDVRKAEAAARQIALESKNSEVRVEYLDLSKLDTVRGFAQRVGRCNILVNNAGLMKARCETEDGVELTMLTNHLGPFLLTTLLLPVIRRTADESGVVGRIIVVGSRLEKMASLTEGWLLRGPSPFNTFTAYANSKLGNMLMTNELARRLKQQDVHNVVVNAMTPGMVRTNLSSFAPLWQRVLYYPLSLLLRHPDKGAETIVFMAEAESMAKVSGKYLYDCKELSASPSARSESLAAGVWRMSEAAVSGRAVGARQADLETVQGTLQRAT